MGVVIYRNPAEFREALSLKQGQVYLITSRSKLRTETLLGLEKIAEEGGHSDLALQYALFDVVEKDVKDFFRQAACLDSKWDFSFSSKVILSIPAYRDIQQLFIIHRYISIYPDRNILLLSPDGRYRRLLQRLFTTAQPFRNFSLPSLYAWSRMLRTLLRTLVNRNKSTECRVLVATLSMGAPATSIDTYFGELAQILGRVTPTLTIYLAAGTTIKLPKENIRKPLESYASVFDVVAAWGYTLRMCFEKENQAEIIIGNHNFKPLWKYLRRTEICSGEHFMNRFIRLAYYRALRTVRPEVLVYPLENRSWEKCLLANARKLNIKHIVGYQHSSLTPRHLAFQLHPGEIDEEYLPDKVISTGDETANWIRRMAPDLNGKIMVGASFRRVQQAVPDAKEHAVLVAISSSRDEAWSLLSMTHKAATLVKVPFVIRTHPTIPIRDMFKQFSWPANVELSENNTLMQDLSRVTIVAYSSSTVVLEGMLYGRLPLFLNIGDIPSGDPIIGGCSFKCIAIDGRKFAEQVKLLTSISTDQYESLKNKAETYAENYLQLITPDKLQRLLYVMIH